jgi:two-component system sensor histidine kinase KdpD
VPTYGADGRSCLLPLEATMAVRGALALRRGPAQGAWSDDERQLLQTCAHLLAGTLERIHSLEVAQASAVEIEGERLRNVLLAAVSHDLRTPLASLIGLAESLELTRPAPSPQQREITAAVAASARRMGVLVDNLLEMARLQSGRVQLNLQWQPIEEVVGTAVAAVPGLADRPLRIAVPADLPLVNFDAVLMERVLVNLLENAVKYTPDGSAVEIAAWIGEAWFHLAVRDHGPGVPADRACEVFRMFERGQREGTMPGVGLGLALCRTIVEAHGGTLHNTQGHGEGAVFEVRLPRGVPPRVPDEECDLEVEA